jgi:assimilatory nitrate reductase catalytic subunit
VVVVDPRRTDSAQDADLHLPILPGTDVALFNAMLHVMLWEELTRPDYIAAHTTGFEALKQTVRDYTPKMAADLCGVPEADIVTAARWFASSRATLSLYCQGLNQSIAGVDKNAALINLHLASGQIGRPGAGPFSLTGQPNAMGGREVGGMANLLSAHRNLADPGHRAEVARLWGVESVPEAPGLTAVEMFEAARNGEIQALWVACTNPAQSMPDLVRVREALGNVPFLVVQEAFLQADTVRYADVLFPASTWGEKEGTVTNSERCITHVNAAVMPPGEARHDWEIVVDFARRLEDKLGRDAATLFPYRTAEAIFDEHATTTRGRDLDITGLSYAVLDARGPQQWPFPQDASRGTARLYEDGVFAHPDGKARFANTQYQPTAESTDARYPLHLNTGRLRDQWHGMSRTGNVAQLYNHAETPVLSMHRSDMERRELSDGDIVRISSRRGTLVSLVQRSEEVMPSQTFFPMHWGGQYMNGAGINALTLAACDPVSRQPELKHAAIKVEKMVLPWRMILMRRGHDPVAMLHALQPFLSRFDYAACGLFGREDGMVVLRAAHQGAPEAALIEALDALLDLAEDTPCLSYRDPRRGISKRIVVENDQVTGVRLVGETLASEWLKEVMTQHAFPEQVRRWALAPVSAPPSGNVGRGRIVCGCLDVSELEITQALQQGMDLAGLQGKLGCGTECGSCVPELRRRVADCREPR